MSERVLGFKEKDANTEDIGLDELIYRIYGDKFIPVVSLEWLGEQKHLTQKTIPLPDKELNVYLQGKLDFYYDLFSAAKEQASEKK